MDAAAARRKSRVYIVLIGHVIVYSVATSSDIEKRIARLNSAHRVGPNNALKGTFNDLEKNL